MGVGVLGQTQLGDVKVGIAVVHCFGNIEDYNIVFGIDDNIASEVKSLGL